MQPVSRPGTEHEDGAKLAPLGAHLLNSLSDGRRSCFLRGEGFPAVARGASVAWDLDIPIEIVACPTVREEDGLAM
ncbi:MULTISPECIES: pantoate--beta-alanine ligase [Mesorhizobium]|uniref:pantoate--beta-alanine ligase n=1 Tax=Mesorhizobium TaxID=68287 RepID=UPI002E35B8FB|nr:pantoate--beta-alanine ligase [Mesorhizobium muleiense]